MPTATELERVLVDAIDVEPDSELTDEPDWVQVRTPSSRRPNHNMVLLARLAPERAADTVAQVAAEHRDRGAEYRWVVGPSSSPPELGELVQASGLTRLGDTWGMALPVPAEDRPLGVAGLTVHEVGPGDVTAFAEVTARGWERGAEFEEAVGHVARKALDPARPARQWIARLHGVPVGASRLRSLPGLGYFQGCAVLPAYRGRGIYRALLHHRLAVLRTLGTPLAVVWADADGSGIACRKLGFTTICSATFFETGD